MIVGLERQQKNQSWKIREVHSSFKDHITTLRDRLMLAYGTDQKAPRLIAMTGCQGGEGVSTLAFYLALSMAQQCRVLLMDADVNAPSVINMVRDKFIPEFPEPPDGKEGVLAHINDNLDVLSSSRLEGDDLKRFDSPVRLTELMDQYRQSYDYVLFDTPPVSAGSTALRIGSAADGVILVVEAERTLVETARRVKEQLGQVRARILGVVLNKRRLPIPKPFYRA